MNPDAADECRRALFSGLALASQSHLPPEAEELGAQTWIPSLRSAEDRFPEPADISRPGSRAHSPEWTRFLPWRDLARPLAYLNWRDGGEEQGVDLRVHISSLRVRK